MENNEQRCQELFDRWYRQELAEADWPELQALLADADEAGKLEPMMRAAYDQLSPLEFLSASRIDAMAAAITGRKTVIRRIWWPKWVAAAAVLGLLGVGYYIFDTMQPEKQATGKTQMVQTQDVAAPKSARAMITLANGMSVYLDSVNNGQLAQQGGVQLVKLADGRLVYQAGDRKGINELQYNTLSNPRGSKVIDVAFSDGTHAWLNAGSSVTYPVAFIGNQRKVSISGEAYFEVAHDKTKPFTVSKGSMTVEVLGTHFNIKAYDDEADMRVTLLEGSVRLTQYLSRHSGDAERVTLKPGKQGIASAHAPLTIDQSPDIDQVMAWKNGVFNFDHADLKMVMQQLARWYDLDVRFEGPLPQRTFRGKFTRDLNLSEVLKVLESVDVKFRVEGRKLIVTG